MKKVTVMIAAIGISSSAMAQDLSGAGLLQQKALSALTQMNTAGCTSFAGEWKGSCQVAGQKPNEGKMSIEQTECSIVRTGGETILIGGTRSDSFNLPEVNGVGAITVITATTADWSDDRTELETQSHVVLRMGVKKATQAQVNSKMRLEQGKLLVDMKLLEFSITCTYEK